MPKNKLLILYGPDRVFAHALIKPGFSGAMDLGLLQQNFGRLGYQVELSSFADLDLTRDLSGHYVLYASSEGRGLFYKEYIEDVLLGIEMAGGTLVPDFKYFRAHHNKSFGEMLRHRFRSERLKTIRSRCFGNYRELEQVIGELPYPCIVKSAAGCGSYGVKRAETPGELLRTAKWLNQITYFDFWFNARRSNPATVGLLNLARRCTGRQSQPYTPLYANKFVVQNYIEGLDGDYKVLVFHDHYYILRRRNRKNGFTASGSGRSEFPGDVGEVAEVLDFARLAHRELNTPVSSLDIARNGSGCHLLEFQCLFFGPYTLQRSPCFFRHGAQGWEKVVGASHLETEFCRAVHAHLGQGAAHEG